MGEGLTHKWDYGGGGGRGQNKINKSPINGGGP